MYLNIRRDKMKSLKYFSARDRRKKKKKAGVFFFKRQRRYSGNPRFSLPRATGRCSSPSPNSIRRQNQNQILTGMAPPRSLPELIEDTAAEVLLRVPADEPAHLVRASLVCKLWRRILLNPAFLRRYREFHRIPPLLGFLRNSITAGLFQSFRFVPTTSASPMSQPPPFDGARWRALSCRHGRVLLDTGLYGVDLVVWDPITGDLQRLPKSSIPISFFISAAVLCPAGSCSCNHLDCHGGPFLVVSVSSLDGCAKVGVYSSETGVVLLSEIASISPFSLVKKF